MFFGLGVMGDYYKENLNLFVGLGAVSRVTRVTPMGEILLHTIKFLEPYLNLMKIF
jgi:hypothetical protein